MQIEDKAICSHLESVLISANRPELRKSVLPALLHCINDIAKELRLAQRVAAVGNSNAFGDEQLNVDVLAEKLIRSKLQTCPSVVTASSEEDPVERLVHKVTSDEPQYTRGEIYTVAFDPLDGSSIIASNWTVGTIFGIWDGASALDGKPAEKQVAAVLGVYGPRTTAIVAIRVPGASPTCFEVGIAQNEELLVFDVTRSKITMHEGPYKTRYFAPANLRAAAEDENYFQLLAQLIQNKYTLRYSGGLVPDIVHMLVKGHGIYISSVTTASAAKLRRLYELTPIALIMECVGADAIDPITGRDVLVDRIENCDERAGLICGTREEVAKSKLHLISLGG